MSGPIQTTADDENRAGRQNRRLRHFLLDRRFQLKYTGMVLGLASVISLVLGLFLMEKVRENSRMLRLDGDFDPAFQEQLAAADARVVLVMVLAFACFLVVLAAMSVFVTHKMVGPIFVMRRYIREIGNGGFPKVRGLRRGDEFTDLFQVLVEALRAMEQRAIDDLTLLERLRTVLPSDHPLRGEVDQILAKKRAMLPTHGSSEPPPAP